MKLNPELIQKRCVEIEELTFDIIKENLDHLRQFTGIITSLL
jgi:hypothetical protein